MDEEQITRRMRISINLKAVESALGGMEVRGAEIVRDNGVEYIEIIVEGGPIPELPVAYMGEEPRAAVLMVREKNKGVSYFKEIVLPIGKTSMTFPIKL